MQIVIATDTTNKQVNGVQRTLYSVENKLTSLGHDVKIISPENFANFNLPIYNEIELSYWFPNRVFDSNIQRDACIHILTEGPVGWAAKRYCLKNKLKFTTSYLTKFPEFFSKYTHLPERLFFWPYRKFHKKSSAIMVATEGMKQYLREKGFTADVVIWKKGVDTEVFKPYPRQEKSKKTALYVGRLSVEKNKADTFGLTIIESLACGTPIAAFPVTGPKDILQQNITGCMSDDLSLAIKNALDCNREACCNYASKYSWEYSAKSFISNLVPNKGL